MNLKPNSRTGEIWIDANTVKAPTIKGATWVAHGMTGAMEFSDNTDDTIIARRNVPFVMNRSIVPILTICWSAAGISPGNCEWQLEIDWLKPNDDTTRVTERILTKVAAASATSNGMIMTDFSEIGKPDEDDCCFHIRLKRLAAGALDTIADTVELLGIRLTFAKKEGM